MLAKFLSNNSGTTAVTYVDDVFSAYTYTGNSSAQTITNGIDLAGRGGMVWVKNRGSTSSHQIWDSVRGGANFLHSELTNAQNNVGGTPYTLNSNGYTLNSETTINQSSQNFVSWTFRKAPKFFDVVTYTGNGVSNRAIPHGLGIAPGMVIVRRTDGIGNWDVKHRSFAAPLSDYMRLESTSAKLTYANIWGTSTDTATDFYTGGEGFLGNNNGHTYVAYVFAHDTATDGIVQCGTWTGAANVNLGWEPQYVLIKSTSAIEDWYINDTSRGLTITGPSDPSLRANSSVAESTGVQIKPNATGFTTANLTNTYIYLAIRRPNKPPTVGTQVYQAIARTGTGAAATVTGVGFAPDLVAAMNRSGVAGNGFSWFDRLRGPLLRITSKGTTIEGSAAGTLTSFGMDGVSVGADGPEYINSSRESSIINHFFKRAPGVFDEVCYTGTGANHTESHSLGVAPELWIIKDRSAANDWAVGCTALANTEYMALNATDAKATGATYWNSTYPTSSVFSLGTMARVNTSTYKYVAYLFATKAGISKVGSYTGNGSSLTLNMGFTTGARFFMCKRTNSTGDWYVFDTTRGIIAGNDGHLSLNTTAAEVTTDDSVDPDTSGLIVNQVAATNINVNAATYIYLAFA